MLVSVYHLFFFNDPAPTEISTLSLHDALPIWSEWDTSAATWTASPPCSRTRRAAASPRSTRRLAITTFAPSRSEEHTSELQSLAYLVCRLLLEKKTNRNGLPSMPM